MILELYLELSYILSKIFIVVTVAEVTKAPPHLKVTVNVTKFLVKNKFSIPDNVIMSR